MIIKISNIKKAHIVSPKPQFCTGKGGGMGNKMVGWGGDGTWGDKEMGTALVGWHGDIFHLCAGL